ncbi:MAG: hypothetical protein IJB96_10670 [Lachnospira sp.]|nr:hypothetical protein [Lachnospira sp.]
MSMTKENKKLKILTELLLVFLGSWGAVDVFLSAFDIKLVAGVHFLYCFAVSATSYFLFKYASHRIFVYIVAVLVGIAAFMGIVSNVFLVYGMYGLINAMDIGVTFEKFIGYDFLLIYIFTILIVLQVMFFVKKVNWLSVLCVLPGLVPCMLFGGMPSSLSMVLLLCFIIGVSVYNKNSAVYTCGILLSVAIVYVAVIIIFPAKEHNSKNWLYKLQEYMNAEEKEIENKSEGGISGGKLGMVDKLEFADKKLFTLQTGYSGDVYLRAYLAGKYKDNSWDKLDASLYDKYKLAFDKSWSMINVYNQQAALWRLVENDADITESLFGNTDKYFSSVLNRDYDVRYENDADRGYWYTPYGNEYAMGNLSEKDGYPRNCEAGRINASQYIYIGSDYDAIAQYLDSYKGDNDNLQKYVLWEKEYRKFVYEAYTKVDSNVKQSILNAKYPVPQPVEINSAGGKLEYAKNLKEYFAENYVYTLEPGAVPQGKDFFDYFVNETNRGYCTYFATAATLILCNAGIPARYVEGFVVNSTDGSALRKESRRTSKGYITTDVYTEYTVDVYDNCAHAWVEIYMDGYGWIPYEFTPGYVNNNTTQGEDVVYEENVVEEEEELPTVQVNDDDEIEYEEKQYDNLKEYMEDHAYVDLGIVFMFLWRSFLEVMKIVLNIVIVLLIIGVIIYIPSHISALRKKRLFKFNEEYDAKETAKQVSDIYAYVDKLSRFLRIKHTDTMSGEAYISSMKEQCEYFSESKVEYIVYGMEKLSFGRGNIGIEEMKHIVTAADIIHTSSYKELKWYNKLLYRFVWHLY